MKKLCMMIIRIYQLAISPILGARCRFHPSCSEYMKQSIELHGVGSGIVTGLLRVTKCHPWNAGGHDPVIGSKR